MINPDRWFILVKGKRHKTLLEIIVESPMSSTRDLFACFREVDGSVSESSLRRDLRDLEEAGVIRIEHGCIIPAPSAANPRPAGMDPYYPEKWAIGRKAAETICEGETIVLDSGTTVLELVRALDPKLHITCITNSLPVAMELAEKPRIETIVLGGSLNIRDRAVYGPSAAATADQIHAQKIFLGTAGISRSMGVTNSNLSLIQVRRQMISMAEKVIVLADSGKFEKLGLATVVPLEDVDILFTSSNLAEKHRLMIASFPLETVFA